MVAKRAKHTVPDNITIRRVEMLLSFGRGLKEKLKENRSHLELHLRRRLTGEGRSLAKYNGFNVPSS